MSTRAELQVANAQYAETFTGSTLPRPPAKRLAIVTCMDGRIEPLEILGLELGDANVLRNAGGLVTDDVLRSLVVSHWLLGTQEALVVGHTECGMAELTNEQLRQRLADEAGADASAIDFLPFKSVGESVRASVRRIRDSPLLPASFEATGYVYNVRTGRIHEVIVPPRTLA